MSLRDQANASAFPNTFTEGVQAVVALLDEHWPSMTDDNEDTIRNFAALLDPYDIEKEPADLAIRTCRCGYPIDGFDEFMFHLKTTITKEIQ